MVSNPLKIFLPALIILFISLVFLNYYESFINLVPYTPTSLYTAMAMVMVNNPPSYFKDPIYFNAQSNLLVQLQSNPKLFNDLINQDQNMISLDLQSMTPDEQAQLISNINTTSAYTDNYMSTPEFMNNLDVLNANGQKYTSFDDLIYDVATGVPTYFYGSDIKLPPLFNSIGDYVPLSFANQFPPGTPSNDIINAYSTLPGFSYNLQTIMNSNNTPVSSVDSLKPFDWIVKGIPMSNSELLGIPTELAPSYLFNSSLSNAP